ncbi:MAG: heavy metal-binding domain-containing protein [Desulfobacterales bacterium]|nr:heavy metal-binding domain-containing protein [Desulfobacterales bacterium]
MEQLILFVVLVVSGYMVGTFLEKRHYRSIEKRETDLIRLPVVTLEEDVIDETKKIRYAVLAKGNAVISIDYFKRFLSSLQNIFGGNVTAYQTLVDRARREAVLRMIEQAPPSDIITNARIETSAIGQSANRRKSVGSVEAFAYGTAVKYKDD